MSITSNWIETPESSQILGFGYDLSSKILTVQFKWSGSSYQYFGVFENIFEDFKKAGSKGRYFGQEIKGKYPFRKLDFP